MKLTCSKLQPATVIKLEERLDAQSCLEFEKTCLRLIEEGEKLLVVDLGLLQYISSAGLRSFLVIAKRLREAGGSLRICCLAGMVRQVFEAAGLASAFPVFDTIDAAVK